MGVWKGRVRTRNEWGHHRGCEMCGCDVGGECRYVRGCVDA